MIARRKFDGRDKSDGKITRRSFMGGAVATAAALALPGVSNAAIFPRPSGIIGMGLGSQVTSKNFLTGVYGTARWENVEATEGNYDWSELYRVVDTAAAAGLKATIVLAAGPWTPEWVFNAGATGIPFNFEKKFGNSQGLVTAPHPWNQVFLDKWTQTIHAFGDEFDRIPEVELVHIGSASKNGMEMQLAPDSLLIGTTWAQEGYRDDLYYEHYRQILEAYSVAFPNTFLDCDVHNVNGSSQVPYSVVDYGHALMGARFGSFAGWLSGLESPGNVEVRDLMEIQAQDSFADYQLIGNETDQPERLLNGSVVDAIEWGLAHGSRYFEVWGVDVQNASLTREFERLADEIDSMECITCPEPPGCVPAALVSVAALAASNSRRRRRGRHTRNGGSPEVPPPGEPPADECPQ